MRSQAEAAQSSMPAMCASAHCAVFAPLLCNAAPREKATALRQHVKDGADPAEKVRTQRAMIEALIAGKVAEVLPRFCC
jgi:hypothetical protein